MKQNKGDNMMSKGFNIKLLFFVMLIFCQSSFAQENNTTEKLESTESTCSSEGFAFRNGALVLNIGEHQSRVFQIQNIGQGKVLLDHFSETDPGMSAGWSSSLDGGNFSLLAMNQPNFGLKCMISNPPVEWGLIDCKRVLSVCSITPKQALGSFWVSENKSFPDTQKTLKQRRIIN